uniref:Uncharacterized protein n=1 Tax=Nelumbo nucifera TaxID=4432 RepID=A0A822YGB4_NELNU|nr:TPA_asm: hypothetical protein HUJ06_010388 [Nelumbo nucifera]
MKNTLPFPNLPLFPLVSQDPTVPNLSTPNPTLPLLPPLPQLPQLPPLSTRSIPPLPQLPQLPTLSPPLQPRLPGVPSLPPLLKEPTRTKTTERSNTTPMSDQKDEQPSCDKATCDELHSCAEAAMNPLLDIRDKPHSSK